MADTVSNAGITPNAPSYPPEGHRPKQHHWWIWILVIVLVVLGIGLVVILRRQKPKLAPPRPISITAANVQPGDIEVAVSALGSVTPVYMDAISPRVDGQLVSVNYTEGQMVKTNDVLAEIDPRPYAAMLTQAAGQLERDKALLEGAQIDLERYQSAYLKKAIPKQQVDDEVALVHQDQGTVKYDEGQVASAQVQLDYCFIRAPISGRVGLRLLDPGNIVHSANTNALVVITQLQPITVIFNIAEDYLPQIERQLQEVAPLTVEAFDREQKIKLATGKLLTLDNLIDSSTGTIKLKAVFSNADFSLFPNQFVNARLIIETLHNVILVPTFAIQRNSEGSFVYLLTPTNTVTTRSITTGTVEGDNTEVTSGLAAGEAIAVDNFNKLDEGVKITTDKPGPTGKPGQSGAPNKKGGSQKKKDASAKDGS